jgi:hypothetical protein
LKGDPHYLLAPKAMKYTPESCMELARANAEIFEELSMGFPSSRQTARRS